MTAKPETSSRRFPARRLLPLATLAFALAGTAGSAAAQDASAAALRDKHASLAAQLAQNAYKRPIHIDSAEAGNTVGGNIYAVVDAPFATVSAEFKAPDNWCDVMMLHLNTKYCSADLASEPRQLKVHVGKKTPQQLKDAFALAFAFRPVAATSDYLAVRLNAEKGPLGTSQYRIEFEAMPLPGGKTFMHLRYGYGYGVASKLAMRAYLATAGSDKVGFTPAGQNGVDGYVDGMRGAVERNTMRYYLAIDAYLTSLKLPAPQQRQARLERWFGSTEQYPRQLHEIDKDDYLGMKKEEFQRLQATPAS